MSANIFERKCSTSKPVETKVELIDKSSTRDEKSSTRDEKRSNVEVKSPNNHVQVKLYLIACLVVAIILVLWLMLEFKKPTEEFGSMPKVSH